MNILIDTCLSFLRFQSQRGLFRGRFQSQRGLCRITLCLIACTLVFGIRVQGLHAQASPFSLLRPAHSEFKLEANTQLFPSSNVKAPLVGSVDFTRSELKGRWSEAKHRPGALSIGFEYQHYDISSPVAGLPDHMDHFAIGFASEIYRSEKWTVSGGGSIGYASVHTPIADGEGIYASVLLSARRELDEKSGLSFYLQYDGNRSFMPDVPIPGIAYDRRFLNNKLFLTVGVPFVSVSWLPEGMDGRHIFNANFTALGNYGVYYRYKIKDWEDLGAISLYIEAKSTTESFHTDISVDNRRVFYSQQHVEAGLSVRFGPVKALIAAGYAFDREFELGFDTRKSRLIAEIDNEPYLTLQLTGRY